MDREIPYFVNKKNGTAHINRDCDYLIQYGDEWVRLEHCNSSSLPKLRLCRTCVPLQLDLSRLDDVASLA